MHNFFADNLIFFQLYVCWNTFFLYFIEDYFHLYCVTRCFVIFYCFKRD